MKINCLLLVDDDATLIRRELELSGLNIKRLVVATSLDEALSVAIEKQVDIILLDLNLRDSKSLDTLRAMRAVTDSVIIVLSQSDDELLGIESLKAGADDFLVKSKVNGTAIRRSIVYSMTRHNLCETACSINLKLDKLSEMVGM